VLYIYLLLIANLALTWWMFMWLDGRQNERYNLFAAWTQNSLMPQLGDIARSLEESHSKRDQLS
jgi:hypothetical protein